MADLDANWVAAIGQVLGAVFTAGAAGIALKTARTAERIAAQGVEATKRQTSLAAIQELWNDYASPEMYEALRRFGGFVDRDERVRERFAHFRDQFQQHGLKLQPDSSSNDDLSWVVQELEKDPALGAARRQIHHHFKRVWVLRRAGVVSDPDLFLLTSAHSGYQLWHDQVLPATIALGLDQVARGRSFAKTEAWPRELISWVEDVTHRLQAE